MDAYTPLTLPTSPECLVDSRHLPAICNSWLDRFNFYIHEFSNDIEETCLERNRISLRVFAEKNLDDFTKKFEIDKNETIACLRSNEETVDCENKFHEYRNLSIGESYITLMQYPKDLENSFRHREPWIRIDLLLVVYIIVTFSFRFLCFCLKK